LNVLFRRTDTGEPTLEMGMTILFPPDDRMTWERRCAVTMVILPNAVLAISITRSLDRTAGGRTHAPEARSAPVDIPFAGRCA
jgi:hypothetical protein